MSIASQSAEVKAWIVAVEQYADGLDIQAPIGAWALELAALVRRRNPDAHIVLSHSLRERPIYKERLAVLKDGGVEFTGATQAELQNAVDRLHGKGTLLVYWVGHGIMDASHRYLLCADSRGTTGLRVLDTDSLLRHFRSPEFPEIQIGFFDCCAQLWRHNSNTLTFGGDGETPRQQFFYFAASAAEVAAADTTRDGFTNAVIRTIEQTSDWPSQPSTLFATLNEQLLAIPLHTRPFERQWTSGSGDQWSRHVEQYELPQRRPKRFVRFWTTRSAGLSRIHVRRTGGDPTILILSVLGGRESSLRIWRDLPKYVLEALDSDVDVISYVSRDLSHQHDNVIRCAQQIRELISEMSSQYMHIIVFTQTDTSSIVRELLATDVDLIPVDTNGVLAQIPGIAGKVRAIFELPVGTGAVRRSTPSLKRNNSENNLWKRLERSLNLLRQNDFPRPRFVEFLSGEHPQSMLSHKLGRRHADMLEVMPSVDTSTTGGNKRAVRVGSCSAAITRWIEPYFQSPTMIISYLTLRRVAQLDQGTIPISDEANDSSLEDRPAQTDWAGSYSDQEHIVNALIGISEPRQRGNHPQIVITGGAGLGKSVILRRHARYVATHFLERHRSAQLCIYMPLQGINLDASQLRSLALPSEPHSAWSLLSHKWISLIKTILLDPDEEGAFHSDTQPQKVDSWQELCEFLTPAWAEAQLFGRRTKLILDAVDEFLVNHNSLTVESFSQMLQVLGEHEAQDRRAQCLLAVRNSLPAGGELSHNPADTYEIRPLSEHTAERLFPGTRGLLGDIFDPTVRQLLLSPLVLVRLGPGAGHMYQAALNTRAAVLRYALDAVVDQSHLPQIVHQQSSGSPRDPWLQALALVAWILYRGDLGFLTVAQLHTGAHDLKKLWSEGSCPTSHCFSAGLSVIEHDTSLAALRSRTVLNTNGRDALRFAHREWQDVLVSDYLAQCALGQMFSELNHRAFSKQIYIDAADILTSEMARVDMHIQSDWLDRALPVDDPFGDSYTLMSICALLGNGPVQMDQVVFVRLLEVISDPRCPEVTRLVAISSFAMRALRSDDKDPSFRYMVPELLNALGKIVQLGEELTHRVSASMAWCYRSVLTEKYRLSPAGGTEPWPAINAMTDVGVAAAAASGIVWKQENGIVSVDGRARSFQIAAAEYPLAVRNLPNEEISLCHYLFLACASVKAHAARNEIFPILRSVFSKESGVGDRIERSPVQEIKKLYESCRQATLGVA
jgi:hypothetical protein